MVAFCIFLYNINLILAPLQNMKIRKKYPYVLLIVAILILLSLTFISYKNECTDNMNIETLHSSHKTKAVLSYDDYMKQAKEALVNKEYANASSLIEAADQKYTDIESGKIVEHSLPLVYAYVMQGKLTEALSTIERVISCYRVFPFTFDYFCILSRMGKLEEALHMLAEIESENAEDIGILTMVYSCRCLVYFSLGKIEEGHTAYEKFDETFRARFWNFDKIPEYDA